MRTFLTSFAAVVLALSFLSSCGTAAKDIKIADLETACDFADAMTTVSTEMAELTKAIGEEDATEEQKTEKEALDKKARDIFTAMVEKEIKLEDVAACDGYKVD